MERLLSMGGERAPFRSENQARTGTFDGAHELLERATVLQIASKTEDIVVPSAHRSRLRAPLLTTCAALLAAATAVLSGASCFAPSDPDEESLGEAEQAVDQQGDWTGFTNGQCVHGVYQFYLHRYGISLLGTCAQPGNVDNCENCGACMIWKSDIIHPDPSLFNQYAWGTTMPQTYDIVVYPRRHRRSAPVTSRASITSRAATRARGSSST